MSATRTVLAALSLGLFACAPTIRTPLKQALPSVTGATPAASSLCLSEPKRLDLGGPALGGTKADLDGDGVDDLALAVGGPGGGAAVFFLHDGQGGLRQSMRVPIPQAPTAIAAGDFNADGIDDLAIGAADPPALHVLLGRGRGEFIAGAIELRHAPAALWSLPDLDRNGTPDLLALDRGGGAVQAILGDGRGEFKLGPHSRLPVDALPSAVTLADADRDGINDLAVLGDSRKDAMIHFVRGDGEGGFGKVLQRRAIGRGARALLGAPLGGDDGHDLVALVDSAGEGGASPVAAVLISTGPQQYSAVGYFSPGPIGDATLADLDLDGDADLVASAADGAALHLIPGDGRGGFDRAQSRNAPGFGTSVLVLGADRRPTILSFGPGSQQLSVSFPQRCGT
jgi:hypothetical protein